jgi:hypothetical protein
MLSVLLCSLDSFLASLGIGLFGCSESNQRRLILAFGVSDLIGSFAGASLHSGLAHIARGTVNPLSVPFSLTVAAVAAFICTRRASNAFFCIPVLLSLDNFITALLGGPAHMPQFPEVAGILSGLFAWSGFELARLTGPMFSRRGAAVAGFGLMVFVFVFPS